MKKKQKNNKMGMMAFASYVFLMLIEWDNTGKCA